MTERIILHIDFDSFFASCEQQFRPELRGKPIGVTAANGRTAIIAASREAKKKGVKNVMRSYEAFRLCPDLELVRADFNKYWDVSKKFIKICEHYSPTIEVFSLDELFLDATYTAHLFGGVDGLITKLKKELVGEVGEYITVSVGIASNKILAKLASGLKKPNGVFRIDDNRIEDVYRIAELTDICGIGSRIEARLNTMGIYTLLKLRRTPKSALVAEFGKVAGNFLYNVGQGKDISPVRSFGHAPDAKSVGRNYCLARNEYDKRIVRQNIYELCEEVCIKLRRLNKKARIFGIFLRGNENLGGHTLNSFYSDNGQDMFEACILALRRLKKTKNFTEPWEGYVRQIGVYASYLQNAKDTPLPLLTRDNNWEKINPVIDRLNSKFGNHTIRNGFLLYGDKLTTVPNGFGADRYELAELAKTYGKI